MSQILNFNRLIGFRKEYILLSNEVVHTNNSREMYYKGSKNKVENKVFYSRKRHESKIKLYFYGKIGMPEESLLPLFRNQ